MASTYARRGQYGRPARAGLVSKPNRRAGSCRDCELEIPAGGGLLWSNGDGTWAVTHSPRTAGPTGPWDRAPVTGGCPEATDRENARLHAAGFIDGPARSEGERIAAAAAPAAPAERAPRPERGFYGYTSSGRSKCEDAPCCGCCD